MDSTLDPVLQTVEQPQEHLANLREEVVLQAHSAKGHNQVPVSVWTASWRRSSTVTIRIIKHVQV